MIETITKQDVIDRCVAAYDAGNGVELSHEELGLLMSIPQRQHYAKTRAHPWIPVHCRWVRNWIRDERTIISIEQRSFTLTYAQWSKEDFSRTLAEHRNYCIVAEVNRKIVGYIVFAVPFQHDAIVILNMMVDPEWRRRGAGTQMMEWMITKVFRPRRRIIIEINEADLVTQLFLRSLGFRATKIVPESYVSRDGIIMEYSDVDRASH